MLNRIEEKKNEMVLKVEKELERRLHSEELRLAEECMPGAAYVELKMNNGSKLYVARVQRWNGEAYVKCVQLLDENLEVIESSTYKEGDEAPLRMIAAKVLMLSK